MSDRIRWEDKPVPLGKRARVTAQIAIRELNKRVGLLKNLSDTVVNRDNVVDAISGVSDRVGMLKNLKTQIKTNIVSAINYVYDAVIDFSLWLGSRSSVENKYKTAHGSTISMLVNYLLGRDENAVTAESVAEVAKTANSAKTAADNATKLAKTAKTTAEGANNVATAAQATADAANEWLGTKENFSNPPDNQNLTQLVSMLYNHYNNYVALNIRQETNISSISAHSGTSLQYGIGGIAQTLYQKGYTVIGATLISTATGTIATPTPGGWEITNVTDADIDAFTFIYNVLAIKNDLISDNMPN